MRKQAALLVLFVALLLPLAASAATAHDRIDASGTTHFTVTETPDHIRLGDENGSVYSVTGAI